MATARRKAAPRKLAYTCNTCGGKYTEKTKKGHTALFGHKSFKRTGG